MKVTREKLPASQIGLEIEISPEASKQTYDRIVGKLTHTVKLPGFRPGKIPRKVLLQRLGSKRVQAEVLETLIQENFQQALEVESIKPLGNYKLRSDFEALMEQFKLDQPLTFSVSVDVAPEINLEAYNNLAIKVVKTEYDPNKVDEVLHNYQIRLATLVPVEGRHAQTGDVATVDYQARLAQTNQEIIGASVTNFDLEMEPGKSLDDLVKGVEGMNLGQTKEVKVTFPEDYARPDLANQEAIFTVTLKELKEKELPELDDDFAQEISEYETLAELREHLENQYREEAEEETKGKINVAISNALAEVAQIDVPETLIEQELESLLQQTALQMQEMGVDVKSLFTAEAISYLKENTRPEAIKKVKTSLALEEVAKRENLSPSTAEIESKINDIIGKFRDRQWDQDRLRSLVTEDLQQEKALAWLSSQAKIEFVEPEVAATANTEEPEAKDKIIEVEATPSSDEVVVAEVTPSPEPEPPAPEEVVVAEATSNPEPEPPAPEIEAQPSPVSPEIAVELQPSATVVDETDTLTTEKAQSKKVSPGKESVSESKGKTKKAPPKRP